MCFVLCVQIKVYSVSGGVRDKHFVEFINSNFFRVKGNDDENYQVILSIFKVLLPYPITSVLLFVALSAHYIHPVIYTFVKSQGKRKDSQNMEDHQNNTLKITLLLSLLLTNVLITAVLIIIHALSGWKYIEYGNEILYNQPLSDTNSDDQAIPVIHTFISLIMVIFSLVWAMFAVSNYRKME